MKYMKLDLLDLHTLIPKLNNCQLLTQHNLYDLKNPLVPPIERANALVYQILPSKGSGAFTLFVKCLQEEKEHMGHQTLAKLFTLPDQVPETPPVQCEDKETIRKLLYLYLATYLPYYKILAVAIAYIVMYIAITYLGIVI